MADSNPRSEGGHISPAASAADSGSGMDRETRQARIEELRAELSDLEYEEELEYWANLSEEGKAAIRENPVFQAYFASLERALYAAPVFGRKVAVTFKFWDDDQD